MWVWIRHCANHESSQANLSIKIFPPDWQVICLPFKRGNNLLPSWLVVVRKTHNFHILWWTQSDFGDPLDLQCCLFIFQFIQGKCHDNKQTWGNIGQPQETVIAVLSTSNARKFLDHGRGTCQLIHQSSKRIPLVNPSLVHKRKQASNKASSATGQWVWSQWPTSLFDHLFLYSVDCGIICILRRSAKCASRPNENYITFGQATPLQLSFATGITVVLMQVTKMYKDLGFLIDVHFSASISGREAACVPAFTLL